MKDYVYYTLFSSSRGFAPIKKTHNRVAQEKVDFFMEAVQGATQAIVLGATQLSKSS